MESFLLAALLGGLLLAAWIATALDRRKKRKERDFSRKLETVLRKNETVEVICPQKSGCVVLTTGRLLFDTKAGFQAVERKTIKRLQGITAEGKVTVSPPKMKQVTIKAENDFVLQNTGEEFVRLVKTLKEKKKS